MRRRFAGLLALLAALGIGALAEAVTLTGSVTIHDPSRIHKLGDRYYVFGTGINSNTPIRHRYSDNFTHWQSGPAVFSSVPAWAQAEVPNGSNMWAPDVVYFNNEYRMYWSYSSFGSQNSVIGLATNTTLDFNDPNYAWVDQGMVIESEVGAPFNAIDAGVFYDDSTSRMWMTFGSHWNGIYITELDPATGKRLDPFTNPLNIARNPGSSVNAIEAPYLTKHGDYYYLFVNWDTCCQGTNSTYKIRVGRSTSPTGPFRDRIGLAMTSGGGELFLATEGNFIGPGHFSEFSENSIDYFSYHYYDGNQNGSAKLAIREFAWTYDGWPILASDLPPGDYNRDGVTDGGDYVVWRNALGSIVDLRANGDNTGESFGVVDQADYLFWRNNYGADYHDRRGAGSLVPEPSTLQGAAFALAVLLAYRFRRTTEN